MEISEWKARRHATTIVTTDAVTIDFWSAIESHQPFDCDSTFAHFAAESRKLPVGTECDLDLAVAEAAYVEPAVLNAAAIDARAVVGSYAHSYGHAACWRSHFQDVERQFDGQRNTAIRIVMEPGIGVSIDVHELSEVTTCSHAEHARSAASGSEYGDESAVGCATCRC